jgi:hypothetical protein
MGHLDEPTFERTIASCARCGGTAFEIATYIDRYFDVMLGERNDDGRWVYDGEKLIDGVYRVTCAAPACGALAFESADCPRCHRAGALADAIAATSRLAAPRRCPRCNDTELGVVGFAPAVVRTGAGKPAPAATALLGEPGFHVIALGCNGCDWAQAAEGCPLCGAAPPLRARP